MLQPYPASAVCDGAHGQPLIPWPNRLEDGSYDFDGVHYSLPLTEPEKSNPIHGLTRWRAWRLQERGGDHALLSCRLFPMPGYPFALDLQVSYRLDETGLTVAIAATNVGERACPYACGQHPSLSAGGGLLDDCLLQFGAKTRVDTDPVRQLPTGTVPVSGSRFDFGTPRRLGSLTIDYAFRDLDRDDEGRAELRLTRPDGATVAAWVDRNFPLLEVYTADQLSPNRRWRGLGVEPMSCPPNALRSGVDVQRLEPGESFRAEWGVRLLE